MPKDCPAPLWLISLESFVWWVYFAFAFFFAIQREEMEVTNPRADIRAGLTNPGERVMLPTPARSLEVGKTGVRRTLLHDAGSACPFLLLPGPARWLLHCPTVPSCCPIPPLHPSAPSLRSIPLLHPAWPGHHAGHVCCGRWEVSPMAMTTSWGWRSLCRGASGISLISLTLLLMQLTSLLLLLSSGPGPKIQSGGGKSTKQAPGYCWLFSESKLAGKLLPPATSYPSLRVFAPPGGSLAHPMPLQPPPSPGTRVFALPSSRLVFRLLAAGSPPGLGK